MTDEAAAISPIGAGREDWRPQEFGGKRAHDIDDPVIEPLWSGVRVLVHLRDGEIAVVDEDGVELEMPPAVGAELLEAARANELVLDGYLTAQAARSSEGMVVGRVEGPTAGQVVRHMFLGSRRSDGAMPRSIDIAPGERIAFVAVDLLSIDGEELLDVPLLERRRHLEGALVESLLVRHGLFVRPPLERWTMSWRAVGFEYATYKGANGRYTPGRPNDTWSMARIRER